MDFKGSTVYQIYPKSFYDSNGDGIGDIRGIIEKLDYIQSLGADYIWSTPFFASPMQDNGYDVEDYRSIHPLFGTMEDVEELIEKARERGIGLMFDMVLTIRLRGMSGFKKRWRVTRNIWTIIFLKTGSRECRRRTGSPNLAARHGSMCHI